MSGHSKWATIKHKKGAADKARGKLFAKLIRQVEVSAREGGGDPETNPSLRTMFQKARDSSVPLDTIERAIKRGTGELEGVTYESISYEGYGPSGVGMLVDCLTDNRNRTGSEIKSIFSKGGGSMAEPGAVSWQFKRRGVVIVSGSATEDDLMLVALDAGADDLSKQGDSWEITCDPSSLNALKDALVDAGFTVDSAEATKVSDNLVPIESADDAKKVLRLVDALEDNDDVQDVYANFDIADSVMDSLEADA